MQPYAPQKKSELVKAYEKYEAERAKEAEARHGGRPKNDDKKPSSNLNSVSDKLRTAAKVAQKSQPHDHRTTLIVRHILPDPKRCS